jgi:methylenetetrahydrofolate dehydrogenase (NADP+) / methenyltetrahydrofolate cyclohydrolase
MLAEILDGKALSEELLLILKEEVNELFKKTSKKAKLAIIMAGENSASVAYVAKKKEALKLVGCDFEEFNFGKNISTDELILKIEDLNNDKSFHGILVQLPLPEQVSETDVIHAISPEKDVDGFTTYNMGNLVLGREEDIYPPCTPMGVIKLLEHYEIAIEGKEIVVIGRSHIVGKPLAIMLSNRNATVTLCHSKTKNINFHTIRADILCVAVGKKDFIKAENIKNGAIVIDVGFSRDENGKINGDVQFEDVLKKASYLTPVPGGVGPMTVYCLVENLVKSFKMKEILG